MQNQQNESQVPSTNSPVIDRLEEMVNNLREYQAKGDHDAVTTELGLIANIVADHIPDVSPPRITPVTHITKDMVARACDLAGLDRWTFLKIKAYLPADEQVLEQPMQTVWNDAYLAFKGAFDTPIARRKMPDEFSEDVRKRLREFDEMMKALSNQSE